MKYIFNFSLQYIFIKLWRSKCLFHGFIIQYLFLKVSRISVFLKFQCNFWTKYMNNVLIYLTIFLLFTKYCATILNRCLILLLLRNIWLYILLWQNVLKMTVIWHRWQSSQKIIVISKKEIYTCITLIF